MAGSMDEPLPPLGEWATRAACDPVRLGITPAAAAKLFFGVNGDRIPPEDEDRAKKICGRCPVRKQCLAYALEHYTYGIWGGTTVADRRRVRRRVRRDAGELPALPRREGKCPGCAKRTYGMPVLGGRRECPSCGARWPEVS